MEEIYSIRGAISVEMDSPEAVDSAVEELFSTILKENELKEEELSFVLFSQTHDIRTRNAAAAVRKAGYCASVPLFCVQEAEINGMMEMVIRVLVQVNHKREREAHMVYLGRTAKLRPDLNEKGRS